MSSMKGTYIYIVQKRTKISTVKILGSLENIERIFFKGYLEK